MDGFLAVLCFGVVLLLCWGAIALKDAAISSTVGAVNRKVNSRSHSDGVEMSEAMYFYEVEEAPEKLISALREGVLAAPGTRAELGASSFVVPRTYIEAVDDASICWSHGNTMSTAFQAVARPVTATFEDGSSRSGIVLAFPEVGTIDGVVAAVGAMKALRHDVLAALQTIDPEVVERMA